MPKTILIVDDSSSLRTVVKIALVRAGYDVIEAVDGRDGLTQLDKAGKVHLIVSDVNMPNMDGITFVTQVKAHPRRRRQGLDRQALQPAAVAGRGVQADPALGAPMSAHATAPTLCTLRLPAELTIHTAAETRAA